MKYSDHGVAEGKEHGWYHKYAVIRVSSSPFFNAVCTWAVVLVSMTAVTELTSSTAYGKFGSGAVFTLPPRIGWWCMEIPVTVMFVYTFFIKGGSQSRELVPRICAAVICMHYTYRGWIYPYLIRSHPGATSNFSLVPAVGGWMVTITHGYLNGKWFAEYGTHLRNKKWLRDPRFICGIIIYLTGFAALVYHDKLMRDLRSTPGPRYRIPRGGLFEYATQAVYFCELWTWFGFFLISWGPNGLFIFLVSCANLIPRSVATHQWYLQKFGQEYADLNRTYLVPFTW
jgi:3-oxo-5-alpha-steroid 4-dehydrogenase 1